jgi:hypothetical protein
MQSYSPQKIKEWLSRHIPKQAQLLAPANQSSQLYCIFAFRDQSLHAYLAKSSKSTIDILNYLKLQVPAMTIGAENVIRPEQLAELLGDIAELFAFEYDSNLEPSSIPAIVILESSQFMVSSFLVNDCYALLQNERDLTSAELNKIRDTSPFIASDTITRTFSVGGSINSNNQNTPQYVSVMYARESYLRSWVKALKTSEMQLAYLGPSSPPLLQALSKLAKQDFVFVDVQRLSSRIYTLDTKNSVFEYPFPYGYAQFSDLNGEAFNLVSFALRIRKTLKQLDLPERFQMAPVYFHGLPLTSTKDEQVQNVVLSTVDYLFRHSNIHAMTSSLKVPLQDQVSRELVLSAIFISENL